MIPMIRWELRRRRTLTFWWSVGLVLLVAMTVLAYGSVREQSAELNKAFGDLSSSVGSFVGTSDMFSPTGYLNSQLFFITLPILLIILSITLASNLIGKEENSRTLEVLLARPVSRTKLLAAKAMGGLGVLGIVGAFTTVAIVACAYIADMGIGTSDLLIASISSVVFSGAFGAIAFGLYAASQVTRRFAVLAAIAASFLSYIITSLAGMVDWLEIPAKLLPYHYYNPGEFLQGNLPAGFILYTIGIYLVSGAIAIIGFRRRDIA